MKSNELEKLSPEALKAQVKEMKQEYFAMRAAVLSGKEKNSAQLRGKRRDIARAQTLEGRQKAAGVAL